MTASVSPGDGSIADIFSDISTENSAKSLTCIRQPYTLASTAEQGSEIDKLMIDNFLTTLAEISLSIASRNLQGENEGGI